jgi:formylglycine-generating enzyme required for sulfatase activity
MKKKADDVTQALATGDYEKVLSLEPTNSQALAMKKTATEVERVLATGDYETVLRLEPTNSQALAMKTKILLEAPIRNSIGMVLKRLPAGSFVMGDVAASSGIGNVSASTGMGESGMSGRSETHEHDVTLTKEFYIGVYEVTQEQYQQVTGGNPSGFKGSREPVENVSWEEAVEFCKRLSELPEEKEAGRVYRLPTEAEWEYACRASTTTTFSFGDDESMLGEYAWFGENLSSSRHPVGKKKPNAWGLYDMHRNVWEWCTDWYGDYPKGAVTDPVGPTEGSLRVLRGGGWYFGAVDCRSASRFGASPTPASSDELPAPGDRRISYGFRVALSSSGEAVLGLEPTNGQALAMKKTADDIKRALAVGDYETVLRLEPTNSQALAMKTTILRAAPIRNSIGMVLKLLPAGSFVMGVGRKSHDAVRIDLGGFGGLESEGELPFELGGVSEAHDVTLTKEFYIGVYEVTQEQYRQVMGGSLSYLKGSRKPVEGVSWEEAVEFCKRLSELPKEKKAGRLYRLPTEAEWEYACRASTTSTFSFGDDESMLGEYAWFSENSGSTTHPVGERKPNAWGLYDMHGNAFEWCADWYGKYPKGAVTDPVGPAEGSFRVYRGGCCYHVAGFCPSAYRPESDPTYGRISIGIRVALSSTGIPK